jgi:hypothetical protein
MNESADETTAWSSGAPAASSERRKQTSADADDSETENVVVPVLRKDHDSRLITLGMADQ